MQRYAGQNRRNDTAATWVVATPEGRVAAYASLSMTGIDRSAAPEDLGKGAPSEEAKAWWMRLGFHCFDEDDESCLDLYLLTAEISETLDRAE